MGIIIGGGALLPPPAGVDVNDIESINAHIKEYSVLQLMVPFLAHAVGTFVGALLASRIAPNRAKVPALLIGLMFLAGGTMAVKMIPNAPMWFNTLDLCVAYLPMAWLGYMLANARSTKTSRT